MAVTFFKKTTPHIVVRVSTKQMGMLNREQDNNLHTEVRIRLSKIFNAPKEITQTFQDIAKRSEVQNYLSCVDLKLRNETTKKLNKHIKSMFGQKALVFAQCVE